MSACIGVANLTRRHCVGSRVRLANHWWTRLRGLLGRRPLAEGEGLMLVPCRAVHMFGMRYPVDVLFVDGSGGVVATYHQLAPGSRSKWHRSAIAALEVPAGTLAMTQTQPGDSLMWYPNPVAP